MQLQTMPTPATPTHLPEATFLAADPHMLRIRELAERVAPTGAPALIVGESGTGKEVLARFIHAASERHGYPFVKVNCAAVPSDLLEVELFGHEGAAAVGNATPTADAPAHRPGKLELARHGTLLIDEIGEMSLALQAKLLQTLDEGAFRRLGGETPLPSDARLIATSSRSLEGSVARGEFRKDLYYRLKAIRFTLPMLRERRADIRVLCDHFLRRSDVRARGVDRLPERVLHAFDNYGWPGNVRELKHLVERYTILPDEEMMLEEIAAAQSDAASESLRESLAPRLEREALAPGKLSIKPLAARAAEEAEKKIVLAVLEETHWNRRRAAARLDICYKTLLNKLQLWELSPAPRRASRAARPAASRAPLALIPQIAGALGK